MKKITTIVLSLLLIITLVPVKVTANGDTNYATFNLIAGRNHDVGDIQVWNDEQNIYVKYLTQNNWMLFKTHLSIKESLEEIPKTKSSNPIPGLFEYKECYESGVTEYIYVIPLDSWTAGEQLFIAAHAEVCKIIYDTKQYESAWAEGHRFSRKNWATYLTYVIQNHLPVADPNGPYSANLGDTITFDGTNSYDIDGCITSYEWDFGDGSTADIAQPSHLYSLPGEYIVALTVSDGFGATSTAYTTAYINSPPVADGSGPAPYLAYKNTPITLYCDHSYDNDGTIALYEWDFDGDGTYDWNSTNPITAEHTYNVDGSYLAVLRVTDDKGASDTTTASVTIEHFSDNFNDNVLDTTKWSEDVTGAGNKYQETNQEAKFSVVHSGHTWLISKIVTIENWNTVTIEGKWKFSSPLGRPTPEMTLYLYDDDTNQLNGIAYDNWNSKIRYWYTNTNYVQDTKTSPRTYATFKLVVTKTNMEYWENGVKLKTINTTALASTTNFKLKIGGWDASSIANQYVYFDDIQINAN